MCGGVSWHPNAKQLMKEKSLYALDFADLLLSLFRKDNDTIKIKKQTKQRE